MEPEFWYGLATGVSMASAAGFGIHKYFTYKTRKDIQKGIKEFFPETARKEEQSLESITTMRTEGKASAGHLVPSIEMNRTIQKDHPRSSWGRIGSTWMKNPSKYDVTRYENRIEDSLSQIRNYQAIQDADKDIPKLLEREYDNLKTLLDNQVIGLTSKENRPVFVRPSESLLKSAREAYEKKPHRK